MNIVVIKKRFQDFKLDASLRFGREIVALTGPNGSGKTTLLRSIAGLEDPDEGRIVAMGHTFFDHQEQVSLAPEKRNVGYVFQEAALFPWLTVDKNIRFGLKDKEGAVAGKWLVELCEELKVTHLLGRYPARLSGGEAQRVALVRALAPCPDLLLLDEPFSAVDMELRPSVRRYILSLQRKWNIPVVMVTHDHAELHTMADRVFNLDAGRVTSSRRRSELKDAPRISY